jgi:LmbE family N-acetylglucosaminyl deacetylase
MSSSTANARQVPERETVVVVAAHPDDEVLGCGGTIARMTGQGGAVHILLMADGESSRLSSRVRPVDARRLLARKAAAERACAILGCASIELLALPDNRMDGVDLLDLVQPIEAVLKRHRPSTVLTHHAGDVNIDHRVVHDAVIAACRPQPEHSVKKLLFFEVPSSTEWRPPGSASAFAPNWFFDISRTLTKKLEALGAYGSELRAFPHPRSLEAIEALAKWRGASIGVNAAEAFMLGRAVV